MSIRGSNMPPKKPSDSELRALLDGTLPLDEEQSLTELIARSPDIEARLALLSGATEFERDFSPGPSSANHAIHSSSTHSTPHKAPQTALLSLLQPSDDPQSKGRLGTCEVEAVIATGGMAIVYKARDTELNRTVAIKLLSPVLANNPDARERFLREARSSAALDHPNIVPIFSVEPGHDPPYFAMRFVDGESLQERLDREPGRPLPLTEVIPIAEAIAAALQHAHGKNLIHRDLKPSNILLEHFSSGPAGTYLTDFGLARPSQQSASLALTQTGHFIGTPEFMSPEQAAGDSRTVDHRTDLFSLGAVIYTIATGHPPFSGESFTQLAHQITEVAPEPPRRLNADLPSWLANLISRLLAKKPADRPQSAADVLRVLQQKTNLGSPTQTRLTGQRTRRFKRLRNATLLAGSTAALLLVALLITERTGQTALVNALLSARSGHPLYLAGKWGTLPDFETAITQANPGDTVVVRAHREFDFPKSLSIPPGKPLTIRAAKGFHPKIVGEGRIQTKSALRLVDLTFIQAYQEDSSYNIIRIENATLSVEHCKFVRNTITPDQVPIPSKSLIWAANCTAITVRECEVYAQGSPFIAAEMLDPAGTNDTCQISIKNSLIAAEPIWLRQGNTAKHFEVDLKHSEISGRSLARFDEGFSPGTTAITAQHSILRHHEALIDHPWPNPETMKKHVSWSGDKNLFAAGSAFAFFSPPELPINSLTRWRTLWESESANPDQSSQLTDPIFLGPQVSAQTAQNSPLPLLLSPSPKAITTHWPTLKKVGVAVSALGPRDRSPTSNSPPATRPAPPLSEIPTTIERTGTTFPSLSEALAQSRPHDTLSLSVDATSETRMPSIFLPNHAITLRAAPGASPRLVAIDSRIPLFTATAALTLEGLNLVTANYENPPPLIYTRKAPLTLKNCLAHRPAIPGQAYTPGASASLILCHDSPRITIRNSALFAGNLAAITLASQRTSPDTTPRIRFENSLVIATHGLSINPFAPHHLELEIDRSLFLAGSHFQPPPTPYHLPQFSITTSRSIFDGLRLWYAPDRTTKDLSHHLDWRGTSNHYRLAYGFFHSPSQQMTQDDQNAFRSMKAWESVSGKREALSTSLLQGRNIEVDPRDQLVQALKRQDHKAIARHLAKRQYPPGLGPDPAQMGPLAP
ncbi:MAG: serine/threonine-protein kinase [Verrucomicrobiota bacterium]